MATLLGNWIPQKRSITRRQRNHDSFDYMPYQSLNSVRLAWHEPLYGALRDWMHFWYFRVLWATSLAAAFAVIKGSSHGNDIDVGLHAFMPAWGIAILVVAMYALIQRRIELYDDRLVVSQGRGGDRYRYSDISSVLIAGRGNHPSLVVRLNSGKERELFLSAEISLPMISRFLSDHGVQCFEGGNETEKELR